MDVIGVAFGNVHEDPDNVRAIDHVNRRGLIGRKVGGAVFGGGIARLGKDEIPGIGIPGHDDAVEGSQQLEVPDQRLQPLRLALCHGEVGALHRHPDFGPRERGFLGLQIRRGFRDVRLRGVVRGNVRLQLVLALQ